jgi:hypothetical protein
MKAEIVPLGERLIAQETDLDCQFARMKVTPSSLQAATAEIAATQSALRFAHLRYHLTTLDVLTPEQARLYGELRRYGGPGGHGHGRKGHHCAPLPLHGTDQTDLRGMLADAARGYRAKSCQVTCRLRQLQGAQQKVPA